MIDIYIPITPSREVLVTVPVNIPTGSQPNLVEINASVGLSGPNDGCVLFRLFRDGTEIYYSRVGLQASETFYLASIQMADRDAPAGTHTYTLTAEEIIYLVPVEAIGPIVMSALAVGT